MEHAVVTSALSQLVNYHVLYLLCACATVAECRVFTVWALAWHRVGVSAVVAGKGACRLVVCERHITVRALGTPTALMTLYNRREASAVVEYYGLLSFAQCIDNSFLECWREHTTHQFAASQVFGVDYLYVWQFYVFVSCL